jgi:hypothetical protein
MRRRPVGVSIRHFYQGAFLPLSNRAKSNFHMWSEDMGLNTSEDDESGTSRFLSETACEILDLFRSQHRRPGDRMRLATVEDRLKSKDPAVAAAISELTRRMYVSAPDANTIELTALGFDSIQRANYRTPSNLE